MRLYLDPRHLDLFKSEKQTGEVRQGSYAARVQIGEEKDGSPMYRYFKTQEQYEKYLKNKGKSSKKDKKDEEEGKDRLKEKVEEGHARSKDYIKQKQSKDNKNLLSNKTAKSLRLYLGEDK